VCLIKVTGENLRFVEGIMTLMEVGWLMGKINQAPLNAVRPEHA
jgi:hypothetical protein